MRILVFRYLLFFLSLVGVSPSLAVPSGLPIAPFEARYTVYAWGLPVGKSILTLTEIDASRYRMNAEVHAIGIAILLMPEPINIQSEGQWRDGTLTPLQYQYKKGIDRNTADTHLKFDWQRGIIQAHNNDQQVTLLLSERVVDPLSLQLLAMWDLHRGYQPGQYTTVIDAELETYQVKLEGEEIVPTALGNLPALRFSSHKPKGNRVTTLWFTPSLDYLLIQAVQTRKGKEKFRIVIDQVAEIVNR
ncbi:MAG: DUF3108 domain-containing protein [Candidatus Competibacteraceae bacterium]|jgi:hypothetical protein|nr:DUF3108 domain-containing protein [Candidatus Competibacteraceae bacterium]